MRVFDSAQYQKGLSIFVVRNRLAMLLVLCFVAMERTKDGSLGGMRRLGVVDGINE